VSGTGEREEHMGISAQRILETLQNRLNSLTGGKSVTRDTDLVADLGLDSLQVMELLMEMEDAFDISIPVNVMADVRTVGELAGAVQVLIA
jgi:acyl carrier protein